jgi:D-alanyl-D-alanine carboxypeptidase
MNRNSNTRPNSNNPRKNVRYVNNNQRPVKKSKNKQEIFLVRSLVFVISMALMILIVIVCISCKHNRQDPPEISDSKITVDYGDTDVVEKASLSSFLQNDVLYVNFSELALKCGMTITGTSKEQTFSVKNGDTTETMIIKADSLIAVINGVSVNMPYKALLKNSNIWLSADFISKAVHGVTVSYNKDTKVLTCKRTELNASTPTNPLYENVTFAFNITNPVETLKNPDSLDTSSVTTGQTTETQKPPVQETPKYDFKLDLSAYEKYMNPENKDDYLIIANRDKLLSADFVPKDLTKVYKASSNADKYNMTFVAAKAFEALVKEAEANSLNIYPCSGYRSYETQKYLFQIYVNGHIKNDGMTYDEAYAYASTYSMIEGASEHQTGLTMDVNWTETTFGDTKESKWLVENAHKFGFVIRYPADKEDVTGISWEPWHLRYVGRYHAEKMKKLNMCLEEYLVYLNKN